MNPKVFFMSAPPSDELDRSAIYCKSRAETRFVDLL
jgi:hypothetical protein